MGPMGLLVGPLGPTKHLWTTPGVLRITSNIPSNAQEGKFCCTDVAYECQQGWLAPNHTGLSTWGVGDGHFILLPLRHVWNGFAIAPHCK